MLHSLLVRQLSPLSDTEDGLLFHINIDIRSKQESQKILQENTLVHFWPIFLETSVPQFVQIRFTSSITSPHSEQKIDICCPLIGMSDTISFSAWGILLWVAVLY